MNDLAHSYRGYRFPVEIISHAVWLYYRFTFGLRGVDDLLAQRGIVVSYETIRQWCERFGPDYAARLKRRQSRLGDTWYLDEVFATVRGQRLYLWRAVDQDGNLMDLLLPRRRNRRAAERFLAIDGVAGNLFQLGRHMLRAAHHRLLRERAFRVWNAVTAA